MGLVHLSGSIIAGGKKENRLLGLNCKRNNKSLLNSEQFRYHGGTYPLCKVSRPEKWHPDKRSGSNNAKWLPVNQGLKERKVNSIFPVINRIMSVQRLRYHIPSPGDRPGASNYQKSNCKTYLNGLDYNHLGAVPPVSVHRTNSCNRRGAFGSRGNHCPGDYAGIRRRILGEFVFCKNKII